MTKVNFDIKGLSSAQLQEVAKTALQRGGELWSREPLPGETFSELWATENHEGFCGCGMGCAPDGPCKESWTEYFPLGESLKVFDREIGGLSYQQLRELAVRAKKLANCLSKPEPDFFLLKEFGLKDQGVWKGKSSQPWRGSWYPKFVGKGSVTMADGTVFEFRGRRVRRKAWNGEWDVISYVEIRNTATGGVKFVLFENEDYPSWDEAPNSESTENYW